VYSRNVDGKTLQFGVSGKLWRNAFLLFDRETKSMWSHFTGDCIAGDHVGKSLEIVTSTPRITFASWRERHPTTLVLSVNGVEDPGRDGYAGYHRSKKTGIVPLENAADDRLDPKAAIIGLVIDGQSRAYPAAALPEHGFVTDELAGVPLLIYRNSTSQETSIWDLRHEGATLLLLPREDRPAHEASDAANESIWDLSVGLEKLQDGEPRHLTSVSSFLHTYWFAWRDYYPETSVFGVESQKGAAESKPEPVRQE